MAKKITLKSRELNDLVNVVTFTPKDYLEMFPETSLTGLHKYDKLKDELMEANVAYTDLLAELDKAIRPFQDEVKELKASGDQIDMSAALSGINAKIEVLPESQKVKEAGNQDIEVTVGSDERFDILKSVFAHQTTMKRWLNIKTMLSIDDALNAAVKAE
jgi:hypothetical protein